MVHVENVKTALEARLQVLTAKVNEIDSTLREPDDPDVEERAVENEGDEVLEDMGNAALAEISQINAALQRINLGTYGNCTSCGDEIDDKRLAALPFAANCVDCAATSEERGAA